MAMICGFPGFLMAVAAVAEEAPDPARTIAELSIAYAETGGYIATYRSMSEGKSLDATVGADFASGLSFVRVSATKGGEKIEMRQWSTADYQLFTAAPSGLQVVNGLKDQVASIAGVIRGFTDMPADAKPVQLAPRVLLTKGVFTAGLGISPSLKPSWITDIADASIRASDEKSVTFATKESGLLTISRENGVLVRQTLGAEGSETRVMDLKELQTHPGQEAIAKIFGAWPTAGAAEVPAPAPPAAMRLLAFQTILESAERRPGDQPLLDELMKKQREVLRDLAKACVNEKGTSFASKANWPGILDGMKSTARDKWLEDTPGADAADEKGFSRYQQNAEVRLKLREAAAEGILQSGKASDLILEDLAGPGGWAKLKTSSERGMVAKQSLASALSRTYLEALIDQQMTVQWEQLDNREPAVAEKEAEAAQAISELSAAYAKLGGYTATYRGVMAGTTLECKLGMDYASGLGFVQVASTGGDQPIDMRHWATPANRMYQISEGKTLVIKGLDKELESIRELKKVFSDSPVEEGAIQFTPEIRLSASGCTAALGVTVNVKPSWLASVRKASIQSSDAKSVTFLTAERDLLTISRESGLLVRQTIPVIGDEPRILELLDFKLNPGTQSIVDFPKDWPTTGAVEQPAVALLAPLRLIVFQVIINSAENDPAIRGRLDELLQDQYEVLRHFAQACITESEGSIDQKVKWPMLFDNVKTMARQEWLTNTPAADPTDGQGLVKYLQKPEVRVKIRNQLVEGILEIERAREMIMDDIFGRGGWASLKVGNDRGVEAKKSIVTALSRAYLEALLDMKMTRQWDQRDGFD